MAATLPSAERPRRPGRLLRLHRELHRRKVYRSAVAYVAITAGAIQLLAVAAPALGLPEQSVEVALIVAASGFPLALLLSWLFHLTRERRGWTLEVEEPGAAVAAPVALPAPAPALALPAESTAFVGRERELKELCALLESGRLVTVTGPGGVGKTRLALRAAALLRPRFEHGACLVNLSGLASAALVAPSFASALRLALAPGEDPVKRIADYLREKSLLLVADNYEDVSEAAGVLGDILAAAPAVSVITTSRERLGVAGERVLPLDGLEVAPGDAGGDEGDAIRLFLEAARRTEPGFAPNPADLQQVARICARVQGMPLAIELASAWVRMLPLGEIAAEIERDQDFLASQHRGVAKRHRSLRGVFEASWRLLDDGERAGFRRLSVFRGGFTREAAEAVAQAPLLRLAALLDKSLLRRASAERFELLEVLRQYAAEKLAEAGGDDAEVRRRHGLYYLGLLREAAVRESAGQERAAVEMVRADADNVRLGWRWAVAEAEAVPIEAGVDGLFLFYSASGLAAEGAAAFASAAHALEDLPAPAVALRLRAREALFRSHLGEYAQAREILERCADAAEALGDRGETAFALDQLGVIAQYRGEYEEALRLHGHALRIYRSSGEVARTGLVLSHTGRVAFGMGDYERAEEMFRESLEILRAAGDRAATFASLCNLGVLYSVRRDFSAADGLFQQALEVARETNNRRGIANVLLNLGVAAEERGDSQRAEPFLREGAAISREMGFRGLLAHSLNGLAQAAVSQGQLSAAAGHAREAIRTSHAIHDRPLLLESLTTWARVIAPLRREAALALLALVQADPAADSHTRDTAARHAAELRGARGDGDDSASTVVDAGATPAAAASLVPATIEDAVREALAL